VSRSKLQMAHIIPLSIVKSIIFIIISTVSNQSLSLSGEGTSHGGVEKFLGEPLLRIHTNARSNFCIENQMKNIIMVFHNILPGQWCTKFCFWNNFALKRRQLDLRFPC